MTPEEAFEIEIEEPGTPPRRVRVPSGRPFLVGRSSQSDLRLDSEGVRRFHLDLAPDARGCRLRARDGEVWVDGKPVVHPERELADGCVIRLGSPQGVLLRVSRLAPGGDSAPVLRPFLLHAARLSVPPIVFDVDLEVREGEVVAILGRSSSGKSTLLSALAGLLAHSGTLVRDPPDLGAAFVPQEDTLFSELTPEQTLHFASRLSSPGAPRASEEELHRIAEEMELDGLLGKRSANLSGGARRRVSIAAALATCPGLLLLDEPDSGLDPFHSGVLMNLLRNLADRRHLGVVLTTHSLLHMRLLDRVLVLDGGRVRAQGGPAEVAAAHGLDVDDFGRIYQQLGEPPAGPPVHVRTYAPPAPPPVPSPPSPRRLAVLVERGLLRRVAVPSAWLGATIFPLAVGLAIRLVWWALAGWEKGPAELLSMALLGQVAAIWLGLTAGVQEIVGELPAYRQERLLGVRDSEYLVAKFLSLGTLVAGQVLLLGATLLFGAPFAPVTFLAGLAVAGFSGLALGLAVSALSPTRELALALVPVLMIPQILFSRATDFPVEGSTPWLARECLSRLAFTRHLEGLFGTRAVLEEGWAARPSDWTNTAGQLAGLIVVLAGLAFLGLAIEERRARRVTPP
ncbi:MAG: ATP-binding cassette domain-containing protein [Planctomycetes bacterium]|nr:ATP-binding cassette domain-containing protein [Planctomycetota bacterium]